MARANARTMPNGPKSLGRKSLGLLAAMTAGLMLSACADGQNPLGGDMKLASNDAADGQTVTSSNAKSELEKATEYWGKQYEAKSTDKTAALSYAKNLKAMGDKRKALIVLQDASVIHSRDPELLGEFGRLAVEFDQLTVASRALEAADVPEKPDWKVISARGTVLAKQGQHKAAIPFFERALTLAPNQPSLLNNLAVATAMSGDAAKAEEILRTASASTGASEKVNQNLALVQGLQGKYDEAKQTGAKSTSVDVAAANSDYLKRMVRLPAKTAPVSTAIATAAATAPVATVTGKIGSEADGDRYGQRRDGRGGLADQRREQRRGRQRGHERLEAVELSLELPEVFSDTENICGAPGNRCAVLVLAIEGDRIFLVGWVKRGPCRVQTQHKQNATMWGHILLGLPPAQGRG